MCFYYDDDYGEVKFQRIEIVTARKQHHCDSCQNPIRPREQYQKFSGLYDGHFFTTRICNLCVQDRHAIHRWELRHGCRWHESWAPVEEIASLIRRGNEDGYYKELPDESDEHAGRPVLFWPYDESPAATHIDLKTLVKAS